MSGDLAAGTCPTYAVVDKRKKKKEVEMDQESSADIALYAVVDKTKKKSAFSPDIHKNYDENEYSTAEVKCTESHATREEESQPTYSVLEQHRTSEVVSSKNSSSFNRFGDKDKKWKISGSISQVWLCLVIVIFAVAILVVAFGISAGVSYSMISRLRADISSNKSEALEVSLNKELVNSLRYDLVLLQNKTYNNSDQLSSSNLFELVNQLNKSTILNHESIFLLKAALNDSNFHLFELVNQLNKSTILNQESNFSLIAGLNDNLFELVNELNMSTILNYGLLKNRIDIIENATFGRSRFVPAHSCHAINMFQPSSTSGYYWVRSSSGSSVRVYCDMTTSCGNVTGGLTRVAILNNENRHQLCIDNFMTTNGNTRCIRSTPMAGCSSIVFPVMNIPYSHICGTVQAFWFGTPEGFTGNQRSSNTTIDGNYVDGISLTYGTSSRTHIWTFIAEDNQDCPGEVPGYVGNHYSCLNNEFSCTSSSSLCYSPFFRLLQELVTQDIELRLCRDQHRDHNHEGIYLGNLEIYVW